MNYPDRSTIREEADRILVDYFDLVIELMGSFKIHLQYASRKFSPSDQILLPAEPSKRKQTEIVEDILDLDFRLKGLVEKVVEHEKINRFLGYLEHHSLDYRSAFSEMQLGINKLESDLISSLHIAKTSKKQMFLKTIEPVSIETLTVHASRLSKITSAIKENKIFEAPLPQEHTIRSGLLFNQKNIHPAVDPKEKSVSYEDSDAHGQENATQVMEDSIKDENIDNTEEERGKWLNLEP